MGELEGLDTHEPLAARLERHAFDRLIMLSDGVFAIAITLAALELRPSGQFTDLPSLWAELQAPLYAYLVSFAVVSAYWASHRDIFARLKRVDGGMTALTLALLFLVALLPTTTRLLYEHGGPSGATTPFYCLVLTAIGGVQLLMWAYAAFRRGLLFDEVGWRYRIGRIALSGAMAALFAWVAFSGGQARTGPSYITLLLVALFVAIGRRLLMPLLTRKPH